MKLHDYLPGAFTPTDLQSKQVKDAYAEASHLDVLLSEPQRQIKLRSRYIAASALRQAKARPDSKVTVTDGEVVKLIEQIAESFSQGVNSISPFHRDAQLWFQKSLGQSPEHLTAWILVIRETITAAETEISLEGFILYEARAREALGLLCRLRSSLLLQEQLDLINEQTVDSFLLMAKISSGQDDAALRPTLIEIGHDFLRSFTQLLKFGSDSEIRLNLARFWSEIYSARFTCSEQEWEFLLYAYELKLNQHLGPENALALMPYWETLLRAKSRFNFIGTISRHFPLLEERVKAEQPQIEFPWKEVLQITLAEILLSAGNPHAVSALNYRTALESGPLTAASPADFKRFSFSIINASRSLVERNWLDWLEDALLRLEKTLTARYESSFSEKTLSSAIEVTAGNLRQGLTIFNSHPLLEKDIALVLQMAQQSLFLLPTVAAARLWFREWFALAYAAAYAEGIWQHAKTIVRAVRTSLNQTTEGQAYVRKHELSLQLLEEIPQIILEAKYVLHAIPQVSRQSLRLANPPWNETWEADGIWLIRTALIQFLTYGPAAAAEQTLKRIGAELAPFRPQVSVEEFEKFTYLLQEKIQEITEIKEENFAKAFHVITEKSVAIFLGYRLWFKADAFSTAIVDRIYQRFPNYGEKALASARLPNHEELLSREDYQTITASIAKKTSARDVTATLQRIAWILQTPLTDTREEFKVWWQKMISSFTMTRPPGFFPIACEEMLRVLQQHLGRSAAQVIEAIIRSTYDSADQKTNGTTSPLRNKTSLAWRYPLEDELHRHPAYFAADELTAAWNDYLLRNHRAAYTLSRLNLEEKSLQEFILSLSRYLPAFEWSGILSTGVSTAWADFLFEKTLDAQALAHYLIHLQIQPDTSTEWTISLRLKDFLQALQELHEQISVGLSLIQAAADLSKEVQPALHRFASQAEDLRKELPLVYERLGELLRDNPGPLALLSWQRFLQEDVLSLTSESSLEIQDELWPATISTLDKSATTFGQEKLRTYFLQLWSTGRERNRWHKLHSHLFSQKKTPIFSPNPNEEKEWCQVLSMLTSLHQLQALLSETELELVRLHLIQSYSIVQTKVFTEKLAKVIEMIGAKLSPEDQVILQDQARKLTNAVGRVQILKQTWADRNNTDHPLAPLVREWNISAEELLILRLNLLKGISLSGSTTRLGVPNGIKLISPRLLNQLGRHDAERFNAQLSSLIQDQDEAELWRAWFHLIQQAQSVHSQIEAFKNRSFPELAPANRPLLQSLGLRLALAEWKKDKEQEVLLWYRDDQPAFSAKLVLDQEKNLFNLLEKEEKKLFRSEFKSDTAALDLKKLTVLWLASRRLVQKKGEMANRLAQQLAPAFEGNYGHDQKTWATLLEEKTSLLLTVLSESLLKEENQPHSQLWVVIRAELYRHLGRLTPSFLQTLDSLFEEELDARSLTLVKERMALHFPSLRQLRKYPLWPELLDKDTPGSFSESELDWSYFWKEAGVMQFTSSVKTPVRKIGRELSGPRLLSYAEMLDLSEEDWIEANLTEVLDFIEAGFAEFEWSGQISQELTYLWVSSLQARPGLAPILKRMLHQLLATDAAGTELTLVLRLKNYFQMLLDYHETCVAGLELEKNGPSFLQKAFVSGPDGGSILTTAKAFRNNTSSSTEPPREILVFLLNLGRNLTLGSSAQSRLKTISTFITDVAPFLEPNPAAWSSFLETATLLAKSFFLKEQAGVIALALISFKGLGRHMDFLNSVKIKFDPRLQTDLESGTWEEAYFQDYLVTTLLSLWQFRELFPEDISTAHALTGEQWQKLGLNRSSADALIARLREDFMELDFSGLQRELDQFYPALEKVTMIAALPRLAGEWTEKLLQRIPVFSLLEDEGKIKEKICQLTLFLAQETFLERPESLTPLGVPTVLHGISHTMLTRLNELSPENFQRCQLALTNSLGVHLPHSERAGARFAQLRGLAERLNWLEQQWSKKPPYFQDLKTSYPAKDLGEEIWQRFLIQAWADVKENYFTAWLHPFCTLYMQENEAVKLHADLLKFSQQMETISQPTMQKAIRNLKPCLANREFVEPSHIPASNGNLRELNSSALI